MWEDRDLAQLPRRAATPRGALWEGSLKTKNPAWEQAGKIAYEKNAIQWPGTFLRE